MIATSIVGLHDLLRSIGKSNKIEDKPANISKLSMWHLKGLLFTSKATIHQERFPSSPRLEITRWLKIPTFMNVTLKWCNSWYLRNPAAGVQKLFREAEAQKRLLSVRSRSIDSKALEKPKNKIPTNFHEIPWYSLRKNLGILRSWLARLPWAFFKLSRDATCAWQSCILGACQLVNGRGCATAKVGTPHTQNDPISYVV